MRRKTAVILIFTILALLQGCSKMNEKVNMVSVSILPLQYFLQRIGGPGFTVNVLIPPGQSPHTYEPTSAQMIDMSRSMAFFKTGLFPFEEPFLRSITSKERDIMVIDIAKGVDLIRGHRHGHGGHGHDSGIDPHVWLSPTAVKIISRNILDGFIALDPGNQSLYRANFHSMIADIEKVDAEIRGQLKDLRGKKFLVYHPVWSYFARDYGLTQISIEEDGKEPDPAHIKSIVDRARTEKIRVIFVQKQAPMDYARALADDLDAKVVQLDPLDGNWLENMRTIGSTFRKELK